MFAVIFICGNLFLQIAGKIANIRTCKNFLPHGMIFCLSKRERAISFCYLILSKINETLVKSWVVNTLTVMIRLGKYN